MKETACTSSVVLPNVHMEHTYSIWAAIPPRRPPVPARRPPRSPVWTERRGSASKCIFFEIWPHQVRSIRLKF